MILLNKICFILNMKLKISHFVFIECLLNIFKKYHFIWFVFHIALTQLWKYNHLSILSCKSYFTSFSMNLNYIESNFIEACMKNKNFTMNSMNQWRFIYQKSQNKFYDFFHFWKNFFFQHSYEYVKRNNTSADHISILKKIDSMNQWSFIYTNHKKLIL